jgi:hypothetical protein
MPPTRAHTTGGIYLVKRLAEIEVRDLNGMTILQGYQLENSAQWHVSIRSYGSIVIAHGPGNLATMISAQIAGMDRWSIHVHQAADVQPGMRYVAYDCYPDPMGCVVIDGEFMGYSEFMRRIIPKSLDITPETPVD